MIVGEDAQMRELDSAAHRHLTTMLDKTPIHVPVGGVTLTTMVDSINQNVGERMVKFEEATVGVNTAQDSTLTLWKQSKSCEPPDMNHLSPM